MHTQRGAHLPRFKGQPFSTDVKKAKYSSSIAQVGGLKSAHRKPCPGFNLEEESGGPALGLWGQQQDAKQIGYGLALGS